MLMICSTLEDIDRFFETEPGLFVHRNKLAIQLLRPIEFIEADERIATAQTQGTKQVNEKLEVVATSESV